MMSTQGLLFLSFFAVLHGFVTVSISATDPAFLDEDAGHDAFETELPDQLESDHAVFELTHPNSPELDAEPKSLPERYREMIENDFFRHHVMSAERQRNLMGSQKKGEGFKKEENSIPDILNKFEMKLRSGADYMTGQYLTHFKLGTPFQKMMLAMDTGSSLTWVKCKYKCGRNCGKKLERRAFIAEQSPSFKPIQCSDKVCNELYNSMSASSFCPTPTSPCLYNYSYLDGSFATGMFAHETVTASIAGLYKAKLRMIVGCTNTFDGFTNFDGVLGLGPEKFSLAEVAFEKYKGKFSYCLVDSLSNMSVGSHLIFGEKNKLAPDMRFTALFPANLGYYYVDVAGIYINGKKLSIPKRAWDSNKGGGMILDSGTSITQFGVSAYGPTLAAFEEFLSRFENATVVDAPFVHCFKVRKDYKSITPRLAIHFADGVRFEPPVENYIIHIDKGIKCLGILPSKDESSIIGNLMQQNHLWEYDLGNHKLGFAPSDCLY